MRTTIGILGGMGPMATVDFVHKIIEQTPAKQDQDHLPLLIHSVPQIPDRTACLMQNQPSPLPALLSGLNSLTDAGVGCVVIPCNTAHNWYDDLARRSRVPILHIAEACSEHLSKKGISSVGIMATDGTIKSGFYQRILASDGIDLTVPEPGLQRDIMRGIYLVKSGEVHAGGSALEKVMASLKDSGAESVILGCTEVPLALSTINSSLADHGIDATNVLAEKCVSWYLGKQVESDWAIQQTPVAING